MFKLTAAQIAFACLSSVSLILLGGAAPGGHVLVFDEGASKPVADPSVRGHYGTTGHSTGWFFFSSGTHYGGGK